MRADCEATVLGFGCCDGAGEGLAVRAETFGCVEAGLMSATCEDLRSKCERESEGARGRQSETSVRRGRSESKSRSRR